ncbi:hypothetical protein EMIHUDRAFT_249572 [Emiliania huxleyi CCMP1516]|uniref:Uncharacterized protein n=2 Tax=Emiliania huxleyi TaxID=2903 RepID=A0A0D3I7Z7_EMIH1|nr:hypothetical protein EMIHUDRAFT_249572 [Emiliania huxleyi CCMP1516]EOD07382.1 hypothetical protein EMIHUDRAFT_249572 [Emiliania huxleyi CCMP1516]|eukprot:XP_005759811.1 hypothetical protein EMIHUDRAFT_249572 [Emiliania huxleyi CCMP1516]
MSLLALGRNGRSQAGAEASGLDSLMGWAYTTIEFTLFLWSIAVGLAYDGLAALLTSRVYRAGAGAVLLYLLGTTLIELVTSGDGGPELLFFLRMAVFVYCVGYQVRALCDYTPVRVLLLLSGGYPLFRHGAAAIAEPFRDYAAMGPYAGVLLTFSAIYLATRSMGRHVGYFMDTYIKTYVLETRIDSLLRRSPRHISSAFVLALFVGFAFQFGFCLSFGSANSAMCAMYCVLAILGHGD